MPSVIQGIYDFNDQAGLLGHGMDSFLETSFILEEAMEGFEEVFNNGDTAPENRVTARSWALGFLNQVKDAMDTRGLEMPSEVAEVDKAIDGIVFGVGKLAKMELNPEQIERMINIVTDCNMQKLGGPKAEDGKQLKPEGWVGPEDRLQEVLDERPVQDDIDG